MNGQMMQLPLLISSLIQHAERHHGEREVVSRRVEGDIHRTTYKEIAARSRRMAKALAALAVQSGDRVATLEGVVAVPVLRERMDGESPAGAHLLPGRIG